MLFRLGLVLLAHHGFLILGEGSIAVFVVFFECLLAALLHVLLACLAHGFALIRAEFAIAVLVELLEHFRRGALAGWTIAGWAALGGGDHAGANQGAQCDQ